MLLGNASQVRYGDRFVESSVYRVQQFLRSHGWVFSLSKLIGFGPLDHILILLIIITFQMISIDSHSKQVKLLNEYIVALEKQVSAAKKQAEQAVRENNNNEKDNKQLEEERSRLSIENGQLKKELKYVNEQLRRSIVVEEEYVAIRNQCQYLQRLLGEKDGQITQLTTTLSNKETLLNSQNQQNSKLFQTFQEAESSLKNQIRKAREETENLKEKHQELQKAKEMQTLQTSQKIIDIEMGSSRQIQMKKKQNSTLLEKHEDYKSFVSKEFDKNDNQIKQLKQKIALLEKQLLEKVDQLQKQKMEKQKIISQKSNLIKSCEQQKQDYKVQKDRLQEQIKFLEQTSTFFKGKNTQVDKLIREQQKRVEEITEQANKQRRQNADVLEKFKEKCIEKENENSQLKNALKAMNEQIERSIKKYEKLEKEQKNREKEFKLKNEGLQAQNEIYQNKISLLQQKLNTSEAQKTKVIKQRQLKEKQNRNLTAKIQQIRIDSKQSSEKIISLEEQLIESKGIVQSINQKLNMLTKGESGNSQKEEEKSSKNFMIKLTEIRKKFDKKQKKIQQLEIQLKELENLHEDASKNISHSQKEEIERIKSNNNKKLLSIKSQYEEQAQKKNIQISELINKISQEKKKHSNLLNEKESQLLDKVKCLTQTIQKKAEEDQERTKISKQKIKKYEKVIEELDANITILKENVKKQQKMIENLQQEGRSSKMTLSKDKESKNIRMLQKQSFKLHQQQLQVELVEYKKTIDKLNNLVKEKQSQIEIVEDSNTKLRRQIIGALENEEKSAKNFIEFKKNLPRERGGQVYFQQNEKSKLSLKTKRARTQRRNKSEFNGLKQSLKLPGELGIFKSKREAITNSAVQIQIMSDVKSQKNYTEGDM